MPTILSAERKALHFGLMDEEDRELSEAWGANNLLGVLDAVLDGIYVRLGLLLEMGFSADMIDAAMHEVHASNLTKTDDKGNPVINGVTAPLNPAYPAGKVLKGPTYVEADLAEALCQLDGKGLTTPGDCDTTDAIAGETSHG